MNHNNDMSTLVGLQVRVEISEPWDLATDSGPGVLAGVIEKVRTSEVLIRLRSPITLKGRVCDCLIVATRHEGHSVDEVLRGTKVHVAMTGIPTEKSTRDDPFKHGSWKTGLGLIGTLQRQP